jgi:CRP-like cAMP-binding protein
MEQLVEQLTNPIAAVGHLNYMLVILSVSMSSMRWLRVFAICSGMVGVFYYGFLISDNISAAWEGIFAAVNAVQLAIVLLAGRRRKFSEDEELFIRTVMPTLEGNLRARVLKLARWQTREPEAVLVEEGQAKPQLVFIASGAASVEKSGTLVGVCGPGDFLGEMSFLTGRPASATVRVANEIRCCVFDPGVLKALTQKNPGIRQALEFSFNRNLVGKLERMNESNRERAAAVLAPGGLLPEPGEEAGVLPHDAAPTETSPTAAPAGEALQAADGAELGNAPAFSESRPAGA